MASPVASSSAAPRDASTFASGHAHGRALSSIESSPSSDEEDAPVAPQQRSAADQKRIRARAPARRTLEELRIEVHALYGREAEQHASVPCGELPRLLVAFDLQTGRPLVSPRIMDQIKTFAMQQPDVDVSEEEFVTMISGLHNARANSESESDVSLDRFVAKKQGGDDSDASQGEDSADMTSSSDDEARVLWSRATTSSPQISTLAVRKRDSQAFPRSEDQLDDSETAARRLPSSHRRKTATSDPAEPHSRNTSANEPRRVLSGKGKQPPPPSSWVRPRPVALARSRRTSQSDSSGDAESTVNGGLDDNAPSPPGMHRRTPSHPEMPRSSSSGSAGFRHFPRGTSPYDWAEQQAARSPNLSPSLSPPAAWEAESNSDKLQTKIKTLEQDYRVKSQQWNEEREDLHEEQIRVTSELGATKQLVTSLQKELVKAMERMELAEHQTEEKEAEIQGKKAEVDTLRVSRVELEKEKSYLLEHVKFSEDNAAKGLAALQRVQGEAALLGKDLQAEKDKCASLKQQIAAHKRDIHALKDELHKAHEKLDELQISENSLKAQIERMEETEAARSQVGSGFSTGRRPRLDAELAGELSLDNISAQSSDDSFVGDTSGDASFIETTTVRRTRVKHSQRVDATEFASMSTQTDEAPSAEALVKGEAAAAGSSTPTQQPAAAEPHAPHMPPSYSEAELERAVIARIHPEVPALHESRKIADSAALLLESVFHTSDAQRYHALRDGVGRRCLVLESAIDARQDGAQSGTSRESTQRSAPTRASVVWDKSTALIIACSLGFLIGAFVMSLFFNGASHGLGSFAAEDPTSWQISNSLDAAMLELGLPFSTGSGAGEWWLPRLLYGTANIARGPQPI